MWIASLGVVALMVLTFVAPNAMVSPGPLIAAHAELGSTCLACHAPFRGASPERCLACHVLADIGVRTTTGAPVPVDAPGTMSTGFHQALQPHACLACHTDHRTPTPTHFSHSLLPTESAQRCVACHSAPATDLHREFGASCQQCHSTEHWLPASFDHALLSTTKLQRCESCHARPDDSFHRQSGSSCVQCHAPSAWKPSTFKHDEFFVLDRDHNVACATCHASTVDGQTNFKRYSCFGCHEHTPANIRSAHAEEGIRDTTDCVSCHRSADDEGGERGRGERPRRGNDDDD
jgi:hypothetical protein